MIFELTFRQISLFIHLLYTAKWSERLLILIKIAMKILIFQLFSTIVAFYDGFFFRNFFDEQDERKREFDQSIERASKRLLFGRVNFFDEV